MRFFVFCPGCWYYYGVLKLIFVMVVQWFYSFFALLMKVEMKECA